MDIFNGNCQKQSTAHCWLLRTPREGPDMLNSLLPLFLPSMHRPCMKGYGTPYRILSQVARSMLPTDAVQLLQPHNRILKHQACLLFCAVVAPLHRHHTLMLYPKPQTSTSKLVACRVGLRYMLDLWSGCWQDHQADIENGEVGLSQALLADGYNIASMQHEYAGLDFRRQPDRLQCKGRRGNPTFCCEAPGKIHCHGCSCGGE